MSRWDRFLALFLAPALALRADARLARERHARGLCESCGEVPPAPGRRDCLRCWWDAQ